MSGSWINLCTDVAVQIVSGDAATRGVIRNGNREWIIGYNRYLGKCSLFDPELWRILDGLALIQNMCYDRVLIQIDSLEMVKAIQDSSLSNSNSTLIRRIHHLLLNASSWDIQHFPKDRNKTTDCLANMAFDTNK
ncbi:hypothetical protein J1N35_029849 [Gossypium stocksii]|uniref:RNase H type-1 domain-containing protein n=1 Tax=Gossypium stocksii TaxID=47602 RepID=A0A9D3UYJ6_9ROSI|nr:hypothetical protein J1N35_029849 [Gossypium stocksii]